MDFFFFLQETDIRVKCLDLTLTALQEKFPLAFLEAGMGHLLEGRVGHHVQQFLSGLPCKLVLFKWHPL